MAKIKHYSIDETKKVVYADILALTEKEEAEVNKFIKFGYTIVNKEEVKATVKRLDDDYILEYLDKLPEEKSKQALAIYNGLKNEVAKDKDGKKKTTKNGNEKREVLTQAVIGLRETTPTIPPRLKRPLPKQA